MNAKEALAQLLDGLSARLAAEGFVRRRNKFFRDNPETVFTLEIQRSRRSTASLAVVTVNAGILVKVLAAALDQGNQEPSLDECHWTQRVGLLSPPFEERWWELASSADVRQATVEIGQALDGEVIPAMAAVGSIEEMQREWRAGRAPGLTEGERRKLLALLASPESPSST